MPRSAIRKPAGIVAFNPDDIAHVNSELERIARASTLIARALEHLVDENPKRDRSIDMDQILPGLVDVCEAIGDRADSIRGRFAHV